MHIAATIADGRIGPSLVPAARVGLVPTELIKDGDMELSVDNSEEEDPSEHEVVSNHNADRISDLASTPTLAGTLSPIESATDNAAGRSADDA